MIIVFGFKAPSKNKHPPISDFFFSTFFQSIKILSSLTKEMAQLKMKKTDVGWNLKQLETEAKDLEMMEE